MLKKILAIAVGALLGLAVGPCWAEATTGIEVTVSPEHILIGAGFNGEQISVEGNIAADADAYIRVTGQPEHVKLKQKGKALGILWMNLASVEISGNPSVFLLYLPATQKPLEARQAVQKAGIGLDAIYHRTEIVAQGGDNEALFNEYVKLKHKTGLYDTVEDGVRYGQMDAAGRTKPFQATLALPAAIPQGEYQIEVVALKNGAISATIDRSFDVREIGMPAWIASLAFNHGALYGILSVLIALVAGLGTGILFKGGKGAH